MYQSIGINLSKSLDAATKRIKIPAITQRNYYKSNNNYEEEFINFYKSDSTNNDIDYDENLNYLDDEEINDEDNCYYDEKTDCCNDSCMMEKLKNLDCKVIVGAGIGALIGCIGLCLLLKKKKNTTYVFISVVNFDAYVFII